MKRLGLKGKIFTTLLLLSVIPLLVTESFSVANIKDLSVCVSSEMLKTGETIGNYTEASLKELWAEIVKQKALDVAKQIRFFIESHPALNITELEKNQELKAIAVQPVGKTGYTAVHDRNGINHFHINPKIVGTDLHNLSEKFPDFWKILEKSLTEEAYGYYNWRDADGAIRKKYMHCTPVNDTNFTVCATIYIDEFMQPIKALKEKIYLSVKNTSDEIKTRDIQVQNMVFIIFSFSVLLIIIIAFLFTRSVVKPITQLTDATKEISKGDLNVKVDIKTLDEIGQLASAFNKMVEELKHSRKQLSEYNKTLEKEVEERTKELKKSKEELEAKVEELERFSKVSVGRELKMIELKRKIKKLEERSKNKGGK